MTRAGCRPRVTSGEIGEARERRARALNDAVASARAELADTGMTVAREDLALEAAFWAQLPGTSRCGRARRRSPRATLPRMAPFHNYPAGRAHRQSLGRGADRPRDERALAVSFLASCERPEGPGGRVAQGHGPHAHLRTDGLGQDRLHRVSRRTAFAPGRDPGHLRQGPRP